MRINDTILQIYNNIYKYFVLPNSGLIWSFLLINISRYKVNLTDNINTIPFNTKYVFWKLLNKSGKNPKSNLHIIYPSYLYLLNWRQFYFTLLILKVIQTTKLHCCWLLFLAASSWAKGGWCVRTAELQNCQSFSEEK